MTPNDADAVWRRLDAALRHAGAAAAQSYPKLVAARPMFIAVEQVGGRWRILGAQCATPQEARDELAHQFLIRAAQTAEGSAAGRDYRRAAYLLDWERHDELTAAGRRFRVGRVEQVAREGADGPQPPQPEDLTSADAVERAGAAKRDLFIGDADAEAAASSAELKRQLRESRLKAGSAPEAMVGDERTRRAAYPQPVLLGPRFVVMEQVSGRWQVSFLPVETATEARSRLLLYLRVSAPTWEGPGEQICAAYAHAADALERDGGYEIAAAGRRFRIARFEQAVYMGADGPEPPRPSDIDPYLPPAAQMQQAPSEGPPDRPSGPEPGAE